MLLETIANNKQQTNTCLKPVAKTPVVKLFTKTRITETTDVPVYKEYHH